MKNLLSTILLFVLATLGHTAPPPGYTLVFDQEFNSSWLNINTLIPPGTGWGPIVAPEKFACHTPGSSDFGSSYFSGPQDARDGISPFRIDPSGFLRIKTWFDSTANHLRSGLLSTLDYTGKGFSLANGYYEVSVCVPRAGGTWPSFWMETVNTYNKARTTNAVEIDVFEIYGDQTFHTPSNTGFTTIAHQTVHDWTPTGGQPAGTGASFAATEKDPTTGKPVDFAVGWHSFGCLIAGSSITYYIDGTPTFVTPMPVDGVNQPFYMMLDLAEGGGWPIDDNPSPSPNANPPGWNTYPQELAVQYIRAYAPPTH